MKSCCRFVGDSFVETFFRLEALMSLIRGVLDSGNMHERRFSSRLQGEQPETKMASISETQGTFYWFRKAQT